MRVSRRTFLGCVAAVPIADRLGASPLFASGSKPRISVIGAGAFGGWTALHLLNAGADVTLFDAWGAGNARSSSGGETRVIRAIYGPDRIYTEMVRRAFDLWQKLDATLKEPVYAECGTLWLNHADDAYVRSSIPILEELGFPVDHFSIADAKKRYPQIDFNGVKSVWLERRAGALSARRACGVVRDAFAEAGVYRNVSVKPGPIVNESMSSIELSDGSKAEMDAYVFACGPWLPKMFPDVLAGWVRPSRQEIYYFGTPAGSDRYTRARLPIWIDFGERIVYGIPDAHGRGFKVADDTRGAEVDPTSMDRTPSDDGLRRARQFLAARFPELATAPLLAAEVCQYENSPDGNLIVDRHPGAKNVWIAGGGSGHGFKLSPAVGELVAEAILNGREVPQMFRLDAARDAKRKTQFESKSD